MRTIYQAIMIVMLSVPMALSAQGVPPVTNVGGYVSSSTAGYTDGASRILYTGCAIAPTTPFTMIVRVRDITAGSPSVTFGTPFTVDAVDAECINADISMPGGVPLVAGHTYGVSLWERELLATGQVSFSDMIDGTGVELCAVNTGGVCSVGDSGVVTDGVYTIVPTEDSDGDGMPNSEEDVNSNGDYYDDDTDGDGTPDFLDSTTPSTDDGSGATTNTGSGTTSGGQSEGTTTTPSGSSTDTQLGLGDGECTGTQDEDPDCIIPCDGGIGDECTFNDLMSLINRGINFTLFVITIPIAAILFMKTGFIIMTAGGDSSAYKKATETARDIAMGLAVALAAWLIVKAVLVGLGYGALDGQYNDLYDVLNITTFTF